MYANLLHLSNLALSSLLSNAPFSSTCVCMYIGSLLTCHAVTLFSCNILSIYSPSLMLLHQNCRFIRHLSGLGQAEYFLAKPYSSHFPLLDLTPSWLCFTKFNIYVYMLHRLYCQFCKSNF